MTTTELVRCYRWQSIGCAWRKAIIRYFYNPIRNQATAGRETMRNRAKNALCSKKFYDTLLYCSNNVIELIWSCGLKKPSIGCYSKRHKPMPTCYNLDHFRPALVLFKYLLGYSLCYLSIEKQRGFMYERDNADA
jgi:hypothetical protein